MDRKYSWAPGFPQTGSVIKADVVAREMDRIERETGEIVTPRVLLDSARSKESPIHSMFEWNDSVAAEEFRLWRAGKIIQSLRLVIKKNKNPAPARVALRIERNQDERDERKPTRPQYERLPMVEVVDDLVKRRRFLLQELAVIASLLKRTDAFEEMSPVRTVVAATQKALEEQEFRAAAA